jgi:RHS repeat-associated protein
LKTYTDTPSIDFEALKTKQITDFSYYVSKSTNTTTAKNLKVNYTKYKTTDTNTDTTTAKTTENTAQMMAAFAEIYYYHSDHLGTGTFLSDFDGNPYQFFLNLPFGETMAEQHSYSGEYTNRYKFNGKELDEETGFYYYGARYYNPKFSIWLSVDPLAEKYPGWNPYNYCMDNPINMIDPDGRDAILIAFPNYKVETGASVSFKNPFTGKRVVLKAPKLELGHAGVLIIDNKTGVTSYYEYGRYDKEEKGIVRKVSVPNVVIGEDGKPTQESMDKVLASISKNSGHGGNIEGAYIESDKAAEMKAYAEGKIKDNNNPDRKSYSLTGNNCATFAKDVVNQDPNVTKPSIVNPTPSNVVNEYQEEGNKRVNYNSKTKKSKVED